MLRKILLAPDSFKGSLSAVQAAHALARGVKRVLPNIETVLLPLADGGEGTGEILCRATSGKVFTQTVTGPLGEKHTARWFLLGDGTTAVVELAEAAGLTLVPLQERDPKVTTTYGVGELIRAALQYPLLQHLIITLGGSATNDGGAGIIEALQGQPSLGTSPNAPRVTIACDVNNPLTGPRGASAVFGPQKGATPEDIILLDSQLKELSKHLEVPDFPGAGAAGGAAYGLKYLFPHAQIRPGIEIVLDTLDFDTHLENTDIVLTGEGNIDSQTLGGKAVAGVARRAQMQNVPVIALVGGIGADVTGEALAEAGIHAALSIIPRPLALSEALQDAENLLADATERLARVLALSL